MKINLALVLVILAGCSTSTPTPTSPQACSSFSDALKISVLNVGQAEAILISCPDGETQTLIDAGESSEFYPEAEQLFSQELARAMGGDRTLEFAINTHPHRDHMYGFKQLLQPDSAIEVELYLDQGTPNPTTSLEEEIRRLAGGRYRVLTRDINELAICEGARLRFLRLSEDAEQSLDCPHNLNDCSLIARLEYQNLSALLLGDATHRWEQVALKTPALTEDLQADIIKIGHHGSESTSRAFLDRVSPKEAVISLGESGLGTTELYAFPELSVLDTISRFFTDTFGEEDGITVKGFDRSDQRWQSRTIHHRLWLTAALGTTDIFMKKNAYCMTADKKRPQ